MTNDLTALSEAYTKSPNALSLTLLGHALVDAYRAGRLVHIPEGREGMRERVGRALEAVSHHNNRDVWADAAIAAILGDAA